MNVYVVFGAPSEEACQPSVLDAVTASVSGAEALSLGRAPVKGDL